MKILYLLQDFPYPPNYGVRIKVFNVIAYMAKRHECHILSFGNNDVYSRVQEFQQKVPNVRIIGLYPLCSGFKLQLSRLFHLLRGKPVFLARWQTKAFVEAVQEALRTTDYDFVHLDALGMAPYISLCQSRPTVVSTTDAVSLTYKRRGQTALSVFRGMYYLLASWFTLRFERKILPLFTTVHVVSKPDQDYLRSHVPRAAIEYIEHVVTDEVLQYPLKNSSGSSCSKRILLPGILRRGNIAKGLLIFLLVTYPEIYQKFPEVEIFILGRGAPDDLHKQIEETPGIHLLEWVDDYCAEIIKADVVVFPYMRGTGIKTSVLYALALGKSVVATPAALEGIEVQDEVHCFEREVNRSFAEAIISLLSNKKLRKTMEQNARKLILDKYNMEITGPKWVKLYESAISQNTTKF